MEASERLKLWRTGMRGPSAHGCSSGGQKDGAEVSTRTFPPPNVPFLGLGVPDPGGGLRGQREAMSQGSSSQKNDTGPSNVINGVIMRRDCRKQFVGAFAL